MSDYDKDTNVPTNDCISRQKVIDEIEYELEWINSALDTMTLDFNARERLRQRKSEAREILNSVQQLPHITPQPKTGNWIDDKCSVCGKGTEDLISSREWYRNEEPNFCPFCGVKIKEEENGSSD